MNEERREKMTKKQLRRVAVAMGELTRPDCSEIGTTPTRNKMNGACLPARTADGLRGACLIRGMRSAIDAFGNSQDNER